MESEQLFIPERKNPSPLKIFTAGPDLPSEYISTIENLNTAWMGLRGINRWADGTYDIEPQTLKKLKSQVGMLRQIQKHTGTKLLDNKITEERDEARQRVISFTAALNSEINRTEKNEDPSTTFIILNSPEVLCEMIETITNGSHDLSNDITSMELSLATMAAEIHQSQGISQQSREIFIRGKQSLQETIASIEHNEAIEKDLNEQDILDIITGIYAPYIQQDVLDVTYIEETENGKNLKVHASVTSIKRVVQNIIQNSLRSYEATQTSGIKPVNIVLKETDMDFVLAFEDYGKGYDTEYLTNGFSRGKTGWDTEGKIQGTGLGMAASAKKFHIVPENITDDKGNIYGARTSIHFPKLPQG